VDGAVIDVQGLVKRYPESPHPVLDGLSLEAHPGEWVAVTGPSGAGKSTLLHVLGGLDPVFQGRVRVGGVALLGLGDRGLAQFRRTQVGFVFQAFHLVADLSALDNVRLGGFFGSGLSEAEARARARVLLEQVGLAERAQDPPARLSGGERQRVALARALFGHPPVLLCDEPTGNLDTESGAQMVALLRSQREAGTCVLTVTHEARLCAAADRVLSLVEGRLAESPSGGGA
jgi:putative ABC transport system ATP-binding protein